MSNKLFGTKDYSLVEFANLIQTKNISEVKSQDFIRPPQQQILTSNSTLMMYLTAFIVAMTVFFKIVNNK